MGLLWRAVESNRTTARPCSISVNLNPINSATGACGASPLSVLRIASIIFGISAPGRSTALAFMFMNSRPRKFYPWMLRDTECIGRQTQTERFTELRWTSHQHQEGHDVPRTYISQLYNPSRIIRTIYPWNLQGFIPTAD